MLMGHLVALWKHISIAWSGCYPQNTVWFAQPSPKWSQHDSSIQFIGLVIGIFGLHSNFVATSTGLFVTLHIISLKAFPGRCWGCGSIQEAAWKSLMGRLDRFIYRIIYIYNMIQYIYIMYIYYIYICILWNSILPIHENGWTWYSELSWARHASFPRVYGGQLLLSTPVCEGDIYIPTWELYELH